MLYNTRIILLKRYLDVKHWECFILNIGFFGRGWPFLYIVVIYISHQAISEDMTKKYKLNFIFLTKWIDTKYISHLLNNNAYLVKILFIINNLQVTNIHFLYLLLWIRSIKNGISNNLRAHTPENLKFSNFYAY